MSVPGILNPHEIPEEMCDWAPDQPDRTELWDKQTKKSTCVVGGPQLSQQMFDQNNANM